MPAYPTRHLLPARLRGNREDVQHHDRTSLPATLPPVASSHSPCVLQRIQRKTKRWTARIAALQPLERLALMSAMAKTLCNIPPRQ